MVDDPNPYAVNISPEKNLPDSTANRPAGRWLTLIGWLHALFGAWGLSSSVVLLIVFPASITAPGYRSYLVRGMLPYAAFSAAAILGGRALVLRRPEGWWAISVISAYTALGQLVLGYTWFSSIASGVGPFPAQAAVLATLRGLLGLAVLVYLTRENVQRACRVRAAGQIVNFFLVLLGALALLLVVAAINIL
ncbi:MAG: hypothetical protein U0795_11250 [Pirellulales bacterium]